MHPPKREGGAWLALIFPSVGGASEGIAAARRVDPSAEILALAGDGVAVEGDVPEVLPYLDAAAVVAAPIRSGGGMRVKVLEALAAGKASRRDPVALGGLEVEDGEHVLIAETEAEFSAALVELLQDETRRVAIATGARRWARQPRPRAASAARTSGCGSRSSREDGRR